MIASISGILQSAAEGEVVIEVGGIGLRVAVTSRVLGQLPKIGKPIGLYTQLVVREDALSLYGFLEPEVRDLFVLLLGISGIGPRLALAVLSNLSPEVIKGAVVNNQPGVLARVPGVGKKTAEKMIFHLKDRIEAPEEALPLSSDKDSEVLGVLMALGYSRTESLAALRTIPSDSPDDVEARVRAALKYFASP